jgi:hypothetical protein
MPPKLEALREASDPDDMLDLFWAIRESATARGGRVGSASRA